MINPIILLPAAIAGLILFMVYRRRRVARQTSTTMPSPTQSPEAEPTKANLFEPSAFEKFSVYRFSMGYPPVCRVEFNPKSRREGGDIVFHFPDKEKVFLSWGALEKATKKFESVEKQAEHSIQSVKKSGGVKGFEKLSEDTLSINDHKAVFNRIRMEEVRGGFFPGGRSSGIKREALSLHLHCDNSARYFVIYAMLTTRAPEDFSDLYMTMAKSFKCH
jgi:hypothetical protein